MRLATDHQQEVAISEPDSSPRWKARASRRGASSPTANAQPYVAVAPAEADSICSGLHVQHPGPTRVRLRTDSKHTTFHTIHTPLSPTASAGTGVLPGTRARRDIVGHGTSSTPHTGDNVGWQFGDRYYARACVGATRPRLAPTPAHPDGPPP